jgi:hypothetical protein
MAAPLVLRKPLIPRKIKFFRMNSFETADPKGNKEMGGELAEGWVVKAPRHIAQTL